MIIRNNPPPPKRSLTRAPDGEFIIAVSLESEQFELGHLSNRMQAYAEAVLEIALEHVQFAEHYEYQGWGYYPNCTLQASSQYLTSKFIWLIGHWAYPSVIQDDINYLVGILMDFRWEYDRVPTFGGVKVYRNSLFFMVH